MLQKETALVESLDLSEKFKGCSDVLNHIRDQGMCGSCWAQAGAQVMEGRLCIASKGGFSGQNAWISANVITSCGPERDGCQGGNPSAAFDWAARNGVPTGGNYRGPGCQPYFFFLLRKKVM